MRCPIFPSHSLRPRLSAQKSFVVAVVATFFYQLANRLIKSIKTIIISIKKYMDFFNKLPKLLQMLPEDSMILSAISLLKSAKRPIIIIGKNKVFQQDFNFLSCFLEAEDIYNHHPLTSYRIEDHYHQTWHLMCQKVLRGPMRTIPWDDPMTLQL